jgi:hypothetical protein
MFRRLLFTVVSSAASAVGFAQCVTAFPSLEQFTSFTVGTPGTLANNWSNLTGDNLDWNVDDNGTPTAATGPYGDHTTYNTAGKYMYVEATGTGATPNKTATLQSPCYNLLGLGSPYLTFWYHMEGTQMGSLTVDLNLNGTVTSNLWTVSGDQGHYWKQGWLNLAPYNSQTNLRVRFRAVTGSGELSDIAIDDVRVGSLTPVFGCTDATAANYSSGANVNNGTCDYSCSAGSKRVRLDLIVDNYPNEVSWDLKNASSGVVLASGTTNSTSLCVPSNTCMTFTMHDSYGDGICCGYGNGAYFLYFDGALVASGGNYAQQEQTTFNCPPGYSCSTALTATTGTVYTTPTVEAWYNFTPSSTGSYTVTTCGLNTCDTKIWLYDMACGAINVQPGLEGATFADDDLGGCGQQAVVTGNLAAGTLYHVRLGTNGGSCSSINWQIIYNGPAVGCMNTASCNYDPLATVPCAGCCLPVGDPNCPDGPDLQMNQATLQSSLNMATVNITDACAPQEGCVKAMGNRQVLRFTTRIDNIGELDYYIGSPSSQPWMFNTNNCHGHAHYAGYADYVLFDTQGHVIPVGFKNGFCVIDVGCPNGTAHYGCSNMGISAGCYDQYGSGTTCNWIDVTDVPDGQYTLVLRTNWAHVPDALGRHETNYMNNYAQVCLNLGGFGGTRTFSVVTSCPIWTDCLGQPYGDARLDCNGVCNGPTKTGDLSNNQAQDQPDAQQYVLGILGNDVSPATCTDLNNDGEITVTDGALMVNCYTQRDAYEANNPYIHYHPWCEFPRGYVSTADSARLKIGAFDQINKTVDIYIKNPTCRVMGYEFTMSGITIQTVDNLVGSLTGEISMNSSLGGQKVIGLSYVDSSMAKNNAYVPLCRIHYLNLTGTQVCIAGIQDIVNKDANNILTQVTGGCVTPTSIVAVNVKAFLEGPYNTGTLMMNDDLRAAALIPTGEPYSAMGFTQAGGGGGEVVNSALFDVTGTNAIVDWVLLELRSSSSPTTILATRAALIQRDGDLVGLDGSSTVVLNAAAGSYYVALRHRNHLGVMSASAISLSTTPVTVDFRSPGTATWGTQAQKQTGSNMMLWTGNVFRDGGVSLIKYTGSNNDRDPVLVVIGGSIPTNTVTGYYREDTNLSGVVKYSGAGNDRDPILVNIGGIVPTNTRSEQLP